MQSRELSAHVQVGGNVRRCLPAAFLGALVLLLATAAVADRLAHPRLIETLLLTLVLGMALAVVGGRRRSLMLAAVLAVPCLAGKWGHYLRPDLVREEIFLVSGLLFLAFVVARMVLWILRAPHVDSVVLCAGVACYLLLALLWALAYLLLVQLQPGAVALAGSAHPASPLTGFDALYFSFGTLTTVDYGDILPVSRAARMLAMAEAATGVFYMAILIARIVALHCSSQPAERS